MGFDCFDINIGMYHWHRLLALIVGTASLMLGDGTKKAGIMGCSDVYWSKLYPVAIFFKVENLFSYLHMYI